MCSSDLELGRAVAESVRSGEPLRRERGAWIVESTNPLAVNPPRRHRVTSDPLPEESTDTERSADPSSQGGSPA